MKFEIYESSRNIILTYIHFVVLTIKVLCTDEFV